MILNTLTVSVLVFVLTYVCAMGLAYLISDSIIFPEVPVSYTEDFVSEFIETASGERIATASLPASGGNKLLIYSHGNGEDLGHIYPYLKEFQERGISVLAYEYPGYGLSSGNASEASLYSAITATYEYAVATMGFAPENIFLYGRSLGSGSSCWLAEKHPVGGLLLEGAFTSTFRVKTKRKLLPFDTFDNLKRLPSIQSPILLIHGKEDRTVPFSHALANLAANRSKIETLWIEAAGHNNLSGIAGEKYWETVLLFIAQHSS